MFPECENILKNIVCEKYCFSVCHKQSAGVFHLLSALLCTVALFTTHPGCIIYERNENFTVLMVLSLTTADKSVIILK